MQMVVFTVALTVSEKHTLDHVSDKLASLLVFLLANIFSMFLPISSKSESSPPELDSSSVDSTSLEANTLK